jgi:hypothetical protein
MLALLIVVNVLSMVTCFLIAKSRKADSGYWLVMGLLFGPFAIPFVFFAKQDRG